VSAKTRLRRRQTVIDGKCPTCGSENSLPEPRPFNLMFRTTARRHGAEDGRIRPLVYLRPETAQGIFINFLHVYRIPAVSKLPLVVAQHPASHFALM
jgi:glycyl-tRNA synthetase